MPPPEEQIGLGRHLAARLRPVVLGIWILISAGIPATYYLSEQHVWSQRADMAAKDLSGRLGVFLLESPKLWKYQASKYRQILEVYLPIHQDVIGIQVLDASGREALDFAHKVEERS